jgi:hypothetical protein
VEYLVCEYLFDDRRYQPASKDSENDLILVMPKDNDGVNQVQLSRVHWVD